MSLPLAIRVLIYVAVLVAGLVVVLARSPIWRSHDRKLVAFFLAFAALALAVTWGYILAFIATEIGPLRGWQDWWRPGESLVIPAYQRVADNPGKWLLSGSLLYWVLVGVTILLLMGSRTGLRHGWAYAVVGFFGAISVAFTLFYLDVLVRRRRGEPISEPRFPTTLPFCLLAAAWAMFMLPLSVGAGDGSLFRIALVVMHGSLLVPFIVSGPQARRGAAEAAFRWLLMIAGVLCAVLYWQALLDAWRFYSAGDDGPARWARTILSEDCQISISADLVLTTVITGIFAGIATGRAAMTPVFLVGALLLSPATATALFFYQHELQRAGSGTNRFARLGQAAGLIRTSSSPRRRPSGSGR